MHLGIIRRDYAGYQFVKKPVSIGSVGIKIIEPESLRLNEQLPELSFEGVHLMKVLPEITDGIHVTVNHIADEFRELTRQPFIILPAVDKQLQLGIRQFWLRNAHRADTSSPLRSGSMAVAARY